MLTEWLNPTQYGQLALGLTLVSLFGQVVFGGVGGGICRHYAIAAEEQDFRGYLVAIRRLLLIATAAAILLGTAIILGLEFSGYSQWATLALAATVFAIFSGYSSTLNGIQNAARQRAVVAMHTGLNAWLKILLAVAMLVLLGTSSSAVILGFALSALLITASQWMFLRRTISLSSRASLKSVRSDWVMRIWRYSWPFSAWGLFTWAQQTSDRWALSLYGTAEDVGLYAVVFQLGYTPISLVLGLSVTFLSPILYQRAGDGTDAQRNQNVHQLIWRIISLTFLLTGLAILTTALLHNWLFTVLVAADYQNVSYLLPWVILAGGVFASGQMLSLKLMSEMKSRELLKIKVLTALLGIGLNVVGATVAGIDGVVAALIAFSIIYCGWMILLARNTAQVSVGLKEAQA